MSSSTFAWSAWPKSMATGSSCRGPLSVWSNSHPDDRKRQGKIATPRSLGVFSMSTNYTHASRQLFSGFGAKSEFRHSLHRELRQTVSDRLRRVGHHLAVLFLVSLRDNCRSI